MSKHTPGPVTYGHRDDGSMWLSIGDPTHGPHVQADWEFGEANAAWFAAAPDLLELAHEVAYHLYEKMALAAIAKAEPTR